MSAYTPSPSDPLTITVTPGSNIDDLITANPSAKNFLFPPGEYTMTQTLHLDNLYKVSLSSVSGNAWDTHLKQTGSVPGITINSSNKVSVRGISIHISSNTEIPLTVAGCNSTTVKNCYIYGNNNTFGVYFAGPKNITAGAETITIYNEDFLDDGNRFENNVIYSNWDGDNISFALQKNGKFCNNIIRGGKVSVYMCKNCICNNNRIYNSASNGIYVSLPTHNLEMKNNLVYNCAGSGIKIANQQEHGAFTPSSYNINVVSNKIASSNTIGIEMNNAIDVTIFTNVIVSTKLYAIYALLCDHVNISNNIISYSEDFIWLEQTDNSIIFNNDMYSVYPAIAQHAIRSVNSSNYNIITNNTIYGQFQYDLFSFDLTSTGNFANNNTSNVYYEFRQEIMADPLFVMTDPKVFCHPATSTTSTTAPPTPPPTPTA